MPSYLNSSRIRKTPPASLRRHSSSPFSSVARVRSSPQRAKSLAQAYEGAEDDDDRRLDDNGIRVSVLPVAEVIDVLTAIDHGVTSLFCPIPERAGMNSVRIAEVLNFQKKLPPLVSLAHVHALISASSKTERDVNTLIDAGAIRRIKVVGRGNDISGASDFLVTTLSLERLLQNSHVPDTVISDFLSLLAHNPRATTISPAQLPPSHLPALVSSGFLVSSSTVTRNLSLSGSAIVSTASISRASSGSTDAVGGQAAYETLGGVNSSSRTTTTTTLSTTSTSAALHLSLPSIGALIRLLALGRAHLLELLAKSAYRELPLSLLRERWDGAIDGENSSASKARNVRGIFSEIMPNKTKKWRKLWGMRFEWALAECLGAGEVEVFETGSVGLGVRAIA